MTWPDALRKTLYGFRVRKLVGGQPSLSSSLGFGLAISLRFQSSLDT